MRQVEYVEYFRLLSRVFSKHNLASNNNMDVYVEVKRRMCGRRNRERLAEAIAEFYWSLILNISHVEVRTTFLLKIIKKNYTINILL